MTRKNSYLLASLIVFLVIVGMALWLILFRESDSILKPSPSGGTTTLEIPKGPELVDVPVSSPPNYFFLFTHTEDPFNHELSEERYWRVGEMIEEIARVYPTLDLTWTIEFQGSDAKTIADRNAETGLVDYLLTLNDQELVEFGYHAHHDPTYLNRPQNDLAKNPSYEEVYDAIFSWITCEKDLTRGGCVEERGGGLEAILDTFGQVTIVTGLGVGEGFQVERSAGSRAVSELLPERFVGFGLPDHGATLRDQEYASARDQLMAILTPTHETSTTTFWMDNTIRINDGAPGEGLGSIGVSQGPQVAEQTIESLDPTRSHVMNVSVADKYLYTMKGTSPTIWGYSHSTNPALTDAQLNPPKEREKGYALTQSTLEYLASTFTQRNSRNQFVSAQEVVELFVSDDYLTVDEQELEQMALWILNQWDEAPPNWVYDGEDFYSLTDAFFLLASAFSGEVDEGAFLSIYGPWSLTEKQTRAVTIATDDLRTFAQEEALVSNPLKETYRIGSQTLTTTQILYGLSYLLMIEQQEAEIDTITIPKTQTAPATYELLETLGCADCLDSSWSLKPARFQD